MGGVSGGSKGVVGDYFFYCEGKDELLFFGPLLEEVATTRSGPPITTMATVGKRGMGAIASHRGGKAVLLQDRDFLFEPDGSKGLFQRGTVYYLNRGCLENYILDPGMIQQWWDQGNKRGNQWTLGPCHEDKIWSWFEASAKAIEGQQAVRWALAALGREKNWPHIPSNWCKKLPEKLSFEDCLSEGKELIETFRRHYDQIDTLSFESLSRNYRDRFSAENFYKEQQFQNWFHGKDLLYSLRRHKISLPDRTIGFPAEPYLRWALDNRKINYEKHPDLLELKGLLVQMG